MLKDLTQDKFDKLLKELGADSGVIMYFDSSAFPTTTDFILRMQGDLEFISKAIAHSEKLLREKVEGRKPRILSVKVATEQ